MAAIHLIGGEKGGVGKSVMARLLAQFMIDNGIPFIGFDTDRSHASFLRFYKDYASPAIIDDYQSLDKIFEAALADPDRRVVVDLAAQTHFPLSRWIDDSGVLDLVNELDMKITYWNVMDSGKDSVDLLGKLLDQFSYRLNYVLVMNQLRDSDFNAFEFSGLKERALDLNAKVMVLKRLHAPVMSKIDMHNLSFWAAKNKPAEGPGNLGMLERQRIKVWLRQAYDELSTIQP
ncbi:MAG: mobilization protein [Methylobacter sp.]|nr:MAG: mobilization protein [Methylobacter sp.]